MLTKFVPHLSWILLIIFIQVLYLIKNIQVFNHAPSVDFLSSSDTYFREDQKSQAEPTSQANPTEPKESETVDLVAPVAQTCFMEVPESDTIEDQVRYRDGFAWES